MAHWYCMYDNSIFLCILCHCLDWTHRLALILCTPYVDYVLASSWTELRIMSGYWILATLGLGLCLCMLNNTILYNKQRWGGIILFNARTIGTINFPLDLTTPACVWCIHEFYSTRTGFCMDWILARKGNVAHS